MSHASHRALVVGGGGRTGRRVVTRLRAQAVPVRVLSRHATRGAESAPGVELTSGDLAAFDPAVLSGVDRIVVSVEPPYDAAGADAVLHRGLADLAQAAAPRGLPIVLVSQIYITRPDAYPQMRDVILARGQGENALRTSGTPYVIVRPGWLTDAPAHGPRLEQGDTGDGQVSRDTVADAVVAAVLTPGARGRTFEIYDAQPPTDAPVDWPTALSRLSPDVAEPGRG